MNKAIKLIFTLLAVTLIVGLCYAQTPLKRPTKGKTEQTTAGQESSRKQEEARKQKAKKQEEAFKQEEIRRQEAMRDKRYESVDLGLPSGLKWATCNVGASSPEEYGYYYAWGETLPKSNYTEENSTTYGKDYSWLQLNGYIDSKGNLTPTHDAARQNWGGSWRMPTKDEVQELIANTSTEWTTLNGVKGRLVTSKQNGKSIFLPAAGFRSSTSLDKSGEYGFYWSASPQESPFVGAYYLYFYSDLFDCGRYGDRGYGQSVRPVSE